MIRAIVILSTLCDLALANSLTSNQPNFRIVGGSEAAPGEYPFMASVRFNNVHACGGAIVGSLWIITSAHCLDGIAHSQIPRVSVRVGSNQHKSGGDIYQATALLIYPDYDSNNIINDIGLIRLKTSIVKNNLVQFIALDTEDTNEPREVTLLGWGRTDLKKPVSNNLQFLKLQTIPIEDCKRVWPHSTITDKQVCTAGNSGKSACQGDSSGPLITDDGRLTGVLSYGNLCAKGVPDIYTKVAPYASWIKEKIDN